MSLSDLKSSIDMLLADFVVDVDGSDPIAHIRDVSGRRLKDVYSGPLSQWGSFKSDIKKYGKCIICFYEGNAVMSIDRAEQKDLAKELALNSGMLSEIFPDDRSIMYFVDKKSIGSVRHKMADIGAVIMTEHLVPDSYLSEDSNLLEYYRRICIRELSLRSGTIDESRMLAYRLQEVRACLLPVLGIVLLLSIAGSVIKIKTSSEMESLTAMKKAYSGALKKSDRNVDDIEKALSSCPECIPYNAAYVFGELASKRSDGVEFKNLEVEGCRVVIDGLAVSSNCLSSFVNSISDNDLFTMSEISNVKLSSLAGKTEFRLSIILNER